MGVSKALQCVITAMGYKLVGKQNRYDAIYWDIPWGKHTKGHFGNKHEFPGNMSRNDGCSIFVLIYWTGREIICYLRFYTLQKSNASTKHQWNNPKSTPMSRKLAVQ